MKKKDMGMIFSANNQQKEPSWEQDNLVLEITP